MKKIVKVFLYTFILLQLIPFLVKAETCDASKISIQSIELKEKDDSITEVSQATSTGNNINLKLSVAELGATAKYKLTVENKTSEDYTWNRNSINSNSNYIDYTSDVEDGTNIINANSTKVIYLNIEYKNEVPLDAYTSTTFNDDQSFVIQLDTVNNPNTKASYLLLIIGLIVVTIITCIVLRKKKSAVVMTLILGLSFIIPISVYALCSYTINVDATVQIEKPNTCTTFADDSWDTIIQNVQNDNTECYHVGDTKDIDLGTFGTHPVRIANKSTPDECSTTDFSQSACGFVLEFADGITSHAMKETCHTNVGGWKDSDARTYINSEIYDAFPTNIKDAMIDTTVVAAPGCGGGLYECTNPINGGINYIVSDKLYLLTLKEVGFSYNLDLTKNQTRTLDYYNEHNSNSNRIKQYKNVNYGWWLRDAYNVSTFSVIISDGTSQGNNGCVTITTFYESHAISPAFRIG